MKYRLFKCLAVSICLFSLTFNGLAQGRKPFYGKGYSGEAEIGILVKSYPYGTTSTTHGYCFGKGWFIGLGGSFESGFYGRQIMNAVEPISEDIPFEGARETKYPYEGDMMIKIFLDLRKTFDFEDVRLFADIKYGSPLNLANPYGFGDFVRPSLGIVFRNRLSLSAGVDWSEYPYPTRGTDVIHPKQITLPYIGLSYLF